MARTTGKSGFKMRSGNRTAFKMMGSTPYKTHKKGHSKTKEQLLQEGFDPREADQMMRDGATTGKQDKSKGKIIYKDGKKYFQAADGTLHTGQVSDYKTEKVPAKDIKQPTYKKEDRPEPTFEGTDEFRKPEDIPASEYEKRGMKKPKKKSPTKKTKKEYSKEAQNLLKAVPNEKAYNKLSDADKKGFDKAAKKAGLPQKAKAKK